VTHELIDRFGRVHRDLRVSLTDRCSLRCTYCMPAEGVPWLPAPTLLSTDELVRTVRVATELGIRTVRLTGGEPLLRPDVVDVVAALASITTPDGPLELSMTTNGLRLAALAAPLRDAGLTRVNVSIDTLDRSRFIEITRRDRLAQTLAGIEAARVVGLSPIKLNALAMRGVNDHELVDLVAFAISKGAQMRFIEHMPLDAGHTFDRATLLTGAEIVSALEHTYTLTPKDARGAAPAKEYWVDGGPGSVGVIASVSQPFCDACDRVRLTADGQFRTCLFAHAEHDLRTPLRNGASDAELADAMRAAVLLKKASHGIDSPDFRQPDRPMSAIGG
jgi:cyclic pyranopterin phosphate synthase